MMLSTNLFTTFRFVYYLHKGGELAQWCNHLPSTNVSQIQFPDSVSYVS